MAFEQRIIADRLEKADIQGRPGARPRRALRRREDDLSLIKRLIASVGRRLVCRGTLAIAREVIAQSLLLSFGLFFPSFLGLWPDAPLRGEGELNKCQEPVGAAIWNFQVAKLSVALRNVNGAKGRMRGKIKSREPGSKNIRVCPLNPLNSCYSNKCHASVSEWRNGPGAGEGEKTRSLLSTEKFLCRYRRAIGPSQINSHFLSLSLVCPFSFSSRSRRNGGQKDEPRFDSRNARYASADINERRGKRNFRAFENANRKRTYRTENRRVSCDPFLPSTGLRDHIARYPWNRSVIQRLCSPLSFHLSCLSSPSSSSSSSFSFSSSSYPASYSSTFRLYILLALRFSHCTDGDLPSLSLSLPSLYLSPAPSRFVKHLFGTINATSFRLARGQRARIHIPADIRRNVSRNFMLSSLTLVVLLTPSISTGSMKYFYRRRRIKFEKGEIEWRVPREFKVPARALSWPWTGSQQSLLSARNKPTMLVSLFTSGVV